MKELTIQEKYIFTREMETILSSGLSVDEGLQLIEENVQQPNLKQVAKEIKELFYQKGSFSESIKESKCFDPYMEKLVEIGEMNGHLDTVMRELSFYYQREDDLTNRIKEATTYPIVLLIIMTLIVGILIFKVLPIFEKVMLNLGGTYYSSSQQMMNFGKGFAILSFVVLVLILFCIFGFFALSKNSEVKDRILSRFFLTKTMVQNIALAKMTFALSLFVSSGYPLEEAMNYIPSFINDKNLIEKMLRVKNRLDQNESFSDALSEEKIYSGSNLSLLTIGLKSGRQEEVFKKLVELYQKEVVDSTRKFLNIIEPVIVTILSLIVGVILLSIMLPLMGIMSSIV